MRARQSVAGKGRTHLVPELRGPPPRTQLDHGMGERGNFYLSPVNKWLSRRTQLRASNRHASCRDIWAPRICSARTVDLLRARVLQERGRALSPHC